jgi:hypothetical protein
VKANSETIQLPTTLSATTPAVDVSNGAGGFTLSFVNVAAATGVQYAVEASLDGTTWHDITASLLDLGSGSGAFTPPIAADSLLDYPVRFPGWVHVICKVAPNAPPPANQLPQVVLAVQDTRAV